MTISIFYTGMLWLKLVPSSVQIFEEMQIIVKKLKQIELVHANELNL